MAGGLGTRAAWAAVVVIALGGCREPVEIGSAVPGFKATPSALDFGPTALNTTNELTLLLENDGQAEYTVRALRSTAPHMEFQTELPFSLGPGQRRTVTVQFKPEAEGQIAGMLEVDTDSPEAGERGVAQLGLKGLGVKAVAQLSADTLDFGNVDLHTAVLKPLVISNPSAAPTQVKLTFDGPDRDQYSSARSGNQWTLNPLETRSVDIAFAPVRLGATQATVHVQVCSGCEATAVALRGTGVASQLEISPMAVDFGAVSLGALSEQQITVRNQGTTDLVYTGANMIEDPAGVFSVLSAPVLPGNILQAGTSVVITLGFRPVTATHHRGMVQLQAGEPGAPQPKLNVIGSGGAACISAAPRALDFGEVPAGMTATRSVEVRNRCSRPVSVSQLATTAGQGGYFSLGSGATFLSIPGGGSAKVVVNYTPKTGSGESTGTLGFLGQDGNSSTRIEVALSGRLGEFGPCSYQLAPGTVDFLQVAAGTSVTRTLALTNTGTERCFLSGMGLAAGSDREFSAQSLTSQVLPPGGKVQLQVAFQPAGPGAYSGLVEAGVYGGVPDHPTVVLSGAGVDSCLSFQPATIDFGITRVSCGPRDQRLVAYNRCGTDVRIDSLTLDSATSPEFSLGGTTSAVTVPSDSNLGWDVTFGPTDDGEESAAVVANVQGLGSFSVGLLGTGTTRDTRTDRFVQETEAKVDVLFVIDNSGSMMEEQQSLARNFAAFMSAAQTQRIDYHIGVTTTGLDASPGGWTQCPGGVEGGENGRLFPANGSSPRIITPATVNAAEVFARNVQVGWCHWNEQGLDGAFKALSTPLIYAADDTRTPLPNDGNLGFLRPDAKLAIVFVTDEEDFSTQSVAYYETFFRALKNNDPALLTISAIAGPENLASCPTASSVGSRYLALARATGGVVESICTADWAASLQKLSDSAFGARRSFRLSENPSDAARIEVRVDGVLLTSGWRYDAGSQSVIFEEGAVPAPGAVIEVTYPTGC